MTTLIVGTARLLNLVCDIYVIVIIVGVVMSWLGVHPMSPLARAVRAVTEPVYEWIRRYIPTTLGMIDLSPMILLFGVSIVRMVVSRVLHDMALSLST